MNKSGTPRLGIFNTFKTKAGQLTGESIRQRAIVTILASSAMSTENTRTAIAQKIAKKSAVPWKNIYSGIFADFDKVLIPLGLVIEDGRLPLKRGPKALQEKGIPYYKLTKKGIIVALSFKSAAHGKILKKIHDMPEKDAKITSILHLSRTMPKLVNMIFENYVRGYCNGRIEDLVPFSSQNIKDTRNDFIQVYKELFEGFAKLSKSDMKKMSEILD